jgi:predicted 2-oxoglutarate/Fe(II)-dependent dioxygenase YbiX
MPKYNWITDELFTVSDFFSAAECDEYIRLAEASGFGDAPINTAFGAQVRKDLRNNMRVMIDDAQQAEALWQRAAEFVPARIGYWSVAGVNERLRFYRYDVGQQFEWHYDGAFERDNGERSQLTFMIYLNDDFEGGETSFERTSIVPQRGMALFFVHQILHKGQPVVRGRKYVLRTDVMYRYG